MAKFLVVPSSEISPRADGIRAVVVDAANAAEAKLLGCYLSDSDGPWSDSTATDLTAAFAASYIGFKYRIRVSGATVNDPNALDYTYTAPGALTVDQIGALITAELVALGGSWIGSTYNNATNVLEIAAAAAAIGDRKIQVDITPKNCANPLSTLVGAIVDGTPGGAAALSVVLLSPAAIPIVGATIR